ncbi:hypothetical protein PsorP6_015414 [Peronosclerospora sorghi]|uniref:Uncharacterized protein n=1 Tax=Peronosclerospora sorghi TaxID=230839 RepID=A0ACC0WP84_9STRA|nr:hypothetical protein PsorP6_015414 [Peronosclerospora sorghi]
MRKFTPGTTRAVGNIHPTGSKTSSIIRIVSVYSTATAREPTMQLRKSCWPDKILCNATNAPKDIPMMMKEGFGVAGGTILSNTERFAAVRNSFVSSTK